MFKRRNIENKQIDSKKIDNKKTEKERLIDLHTKVYICFSCGGYFEKDEVKYMAEYYAGGKRRNYCVKCVRKLPADMKKNLRNYN